jgi:hypothetical protein
MASWVLNRLSTARFRQEKLFWREREVIERAESRKSCVIRSAIRHSFRAATNGPFDINASWLKIGQLGVDRVDR